MQLPLGWRNSFGVLGSERTQIQYYQTAHGKPIIGGNISRAPAFQMDYFGRIPLFQGADRTWRCTGTRRPRLMPPPAAQAAALMALYDVRYFITFPPIAGGYPYQDTWQKTQDYALQVLPLEKPAFWEKDGVRAYHIQQPAVPFPFRLDLGEPNLEPYLGQGWDARAGEQVYGAGAFWATATDDDLFLPLNAPKDVTLRLAAAPLSDGSARPQALSITVNDVPVLEDQVLVSGWQTLEVKIPASATRRGANRVRLHFAWALSPRQVFPDPASRGAIGATGAISPVNLDVHSFDEAYISAFGADGSETKASPGRRGYNVVVLDQASGRVLDAQGFDTAANSYEADRLARYLAAVPRGRRGRARYQGQRPRPPDAGRDRGLARAGLTRGLCRRPGRPGARIGRHPGRRAWDGRRNHRSDGRLPARLRRLPHAGCRSGLGGAGAVSGHTGQAQSPRPITGGCAWGWLCFVASSRLSSTSARSRRVCLGATVASSSLRPGSAVSFTPPAILSI